VWGVWGVWGVCGVWGVWGTFDIPQTDCTCCDFGHLRFFNIPSEHSVLCWAGVILEPLEGQLSHQINECSGAISFDKAFRFI
jgi:hypothetical protein